MNRLVKIKGSVKPEKFRGQRREIVATLLKLGASRHLVPIERVIKAAARKLKLHRGVTPERSVKYHVRGLRNARQLTEKRAA